MTLIVIHFNDLVCIVLRLYEAAKVLSIVMKVYSIPCHDRGNIYIVVVLQSCTDPPKVLPSLFSETFPRSSVGTYDVGNMKVEENVDVIEEISTAINEEVDIDIKQEEIPADKTFPDIKAEPDEVSCVCICLLLDTFYHCTEMSVVFEMSVFLAN